MLAWYAYAEATRDVVIVDSVDVPKSYEDMGYTSSVMALRVVEKIEQLEKHIDTVVSDRDQLFQSAGPDIPDIEIPTTNLSLKVIVPLVQKLMHRKPKHVRGEITLPWTNSSDTTRTKKSVIISYHIYNGPDLSWADNEQLNVTDPDEIVQQYAEGFIKRVNPSVGPLLSQ